MDPWNTAEHIWGDQIYYHELANHFEGIYLDLLNHRISPEEALNKMDLKKEN